MVAIGHTLLPDSCKLVGTGVVLATQCTLPISQSQRRVTIKLIKIQSIESFSLLFIV